MFEKGVLKILKNDHKQVRKLLDDLTSSKDAAEQKRLLQEIGPELLVHAKLEAEIFYPALEKAVEGDDRVLVQKAYEEHDVAEKALFDLIDETPGTERFLGKAKALNQLVMTHAEEEEKVMFPKARKALDDDRLDSLGDQFERRKRTMLGEMKEEMATRIST